MLLFHYLTEAKNNEGKTRPKLTDAVFTKEVRCSYIYPTSSKEVCKPSALMPAKNLHKLCLICLQNKLPQKASVRRKPKAGKLRVLIKYQIFK